MKNVCILLVLASVTIAEDSNVHEYTRRNNFYAVTAYAKISKSEDGNFVMSPFESLIALHFVQIGSENKTREQLHAALLLLSEEESLGLTTLVRELNGSSFILNSLIQIYTQRQSYLSQIYENYTLPVDFENPVETADLINANVAEAGKNIITNMIKSSDLSKSIRRISLDGSYFQANWTNSFKLSATIKKSFNRTPKEVVEADTMILENTYLNYYKCPETNVEVLELPFSDQKTSIVIILPPDNHGFSTVESNLRKAFYDKTPFERRLVNVALPKFKIETLVNIRSILEAVGVNDLFTPRPMGPNEKLYFDIINHKSVIDVNEAGVLVDVPTDIHFGEKNSTSGTDAISFDVNRPFLFAIRAKDLVLFVGRVTDPTK